MSSTHTYMKEVTVNDVRVFYREAGAVSSKVILLLHGFPTSSHQYRHLIPRLAGEGYRVVAPDLPGFGFTVTPKNYTFTFDNISHTIEAFIEALGLTSFAVYIFDYGAPVAFRIACRRPELFKAIITQNGNAFEEGLGEAWSDIQKYWQSGSQEDRKAIRPVIGLDMIKWQYTTGEPMPDQIPPESYSLDKYTLDLNGPEIQLDLFYDYRNNVEQYPNWQEYMRKHQPPILAVWGKGDPFFIPPGAAKYRDVVKNAEVIMLDAGHFALELHLEEIVVPMLEFLASVLL